MIRETIGFFVVLAALAGIGLGPSLWLLPAGEKRLAHMAAIAPAVGQAAIALLGFPLVLHVGPSRLWAWPVTLVLLLASLGLIALRGRGLRPGLRLVGPRRQHWAALGGTVAVLGVLCGPPLSRGINYAIFRSNASDLFLELSLAEQLRTAGWQTVADGTEMSMRNLDGLRQLAAVSPSAIFGARAIALPIGLSKPATLSWASEIAGVPPYRFCYFHHLLAYAASLLASLALGSLVKLPRRLNFLSAVVVALGFWARFVLESDAGYEIGTLPLLLLAVYSWVRLEEEPPRAWSRTRMLLAVSGAALVASYFPLVVVLAAAFFLHYGFRPWWRAEPLRAVALHGVTAALAVTALAVTGQLEHAFRNCLELASSAGRQASYPSVAMQIMKADGVAAVMGLPTSKLAVSLPRFGRWSVEMVGQGWAVWLGVILGLAGLRLLRNGAAASTAQRIVLSTLSAGLLMGALFHLGFHNARAAGKAFTYVYPYLTLSLAMAPQLVAGSGPSPLRRIASLSVGAWFAGQAVLGAALPYTRVLERAFDEPRRLEDYDVSPVLDYLERHPPRLLMVTIPRAGVWKNAGPNSFAETEWTFACYAMFAFSRYPAYFQSGLVVENRLQAQNMWLQSMKETPDFAVVLRSVDYIGPARLGRKVAETADLVLYRLSAQDAAVFRAAEERLFREREGETACLRDVCVPPGDGGR